MCFAFGLCVTLFVPLSLEQLPKPGVLPQTPLLPHQQTLGDIILGTPKIVEDCESDGVELDTYLPVSHSSLLYSTLLNWLLNFSVSHSIFSLIFPQVIITHGLCHLLGYTHETQDNLSKVCHHIED